MSRFIIKNDYLYGLFWLSILVIIFFFPVVIGIQSLFEAIPTVYDGYSLVPPQIKTTWVIDGATYTRGTVPLVISGIRMIKEGIPPLWMSYSGGAGEVLAGSIGSGLYYPLRLIFFNIFQGLRAFDFYILLRFLIAGFGVFIFLKEIGLSRRASLLGGIAYMFSGYFFVYLTYWFLDIDAILPYVLFAFERYFKSIKWKNIFLAGLFISLIILGSHPQVTIIAGLFFAGYFVWRIFSETERRSEWKRHLIRLLLMMAIAVIIALPYLIDLFVNFSQGITVNDINARGNEHFSPIYLLHLIIAPSMLLETAIGGHLYEQFFQIIPYFGISVLILFFLSIFIKSKPKFLYFFYIFIGLAILKLSGFPLINWIGQLPILKLVGWHKIYGPIAFSLSVLAAFAYQSLSTTNNKINYRGFFRLLIAIPIIFLLALVLAPNAFLKSYVPNFDFLNRRPETIQLVLNFIDRLPSYLKNLATGFITDGGKYVTAFIFIEGFIFAGLTLWLIWLIRKKVKIAPILLIMLLIFELWVYMPKIRDGFRYFNPYTTPPYIEFLQAKSKGEIFRTFATDYTFMSYLGELFQVARFQTFSAIKPKRYNYFLPDIMRGKDFDKLTSAEFPQAPRRFFDALNLKYIISEKPLVHDESFELIYDKDVKIYENKKVLPRAYMVFKKETVYSLEEARNRFYEDNFDYYNSVILEDNKTVKLSNTVINNSATKGPETSVEILDYKPNKIDISVSSKQDGILILIDTFYSGWQVYIDGQKSTIFPANVLLRGVFIPKGEHLVKFVFQPTWFLPSVIISLMMVILSLYFVFSERIFKKVDINENAQIRETS